MAITEDKLKNKKGNLPGWFNRLPTGHGSRSASGRGKGGGKIAPQMAQSKNTGSMTAGMKRPMGDMAPFQWNNIIGSFQPRPGAIQALQSMLHGMPGRNPGMGPQHADFGANGPYAPQAPPMPMPSPTQQAVGYWTNNSMGPDQAPQPTPGSMQQPGFAGGWGWAQPPAPPPPPPNPGFAGGWGWASQMQPPAPPPPPYWPGSYVSLPGGQYR